MVVAAAMLKVIIKQLYNIYSYYFSRKKRKNKIKQEKKESACYANCPPRTAVQRAVLSLMYEPCAVKIGEVI